MTHNRARIEILGHMFQHVMRVGSDGELFNFRDDCFESYILKEPTKENIGMLCVPTSCSNTRWYLSWLLDIKEENGWKHFLLKSIDDGSVSWWHNIGLNFYPKEKMRYNWTWNDNQFALNDRWMKVCYKQCHANIVKPLPLIFEGDSVTLKTRSKFNLAEKYNSSHTFDNWKKLRNKDMKQYFESIQAR